MKTCSKCGIEKPLSEFYKEKRRKHGVASRCKPCHKECRRISYLENKDRDLAKIKEYHAKHKTAINEYQKGYREQNSEVIKKQIKEWFEHNPEYRQAYDKELYAKNSDRIKSRVGDYQKNNRDKCNAIAAKYKATQLMATPAWLERKKVRKVYKKAKELNMHVDHVVPLQNDSVCGLHCWHNLQLLDASLNCSKGNYHWPDMPEG